MPRELRNDDDFFWYQKELDLKGKYEYLHRGGSPARYPCRVYSDFFDDPNGPYTYIHTFVYQIENKCEKCGHSVITWPKILDN